MTDILQRDRFVALVPAGGRGSRLGGTRPKQYLPLAGRTLLFHTLSRLVTHPALSAVHLVIAPDDVDFDTFDWRELGPKLDVVRAGGDTRADSVLNGLRAIRDRVAESDWMLVHDAARPCVSHALIDRLIATLRDDAVGGIAALPVADTLKRADPEVRIGATVARSGLWQAQTPQMFRHALLLEALERVDRTTVTDEASAVEALGLRPRLVEGDAENLKITYARDLLLAEKLGGF
ncbi:MAG: 2-C-methyl-D-erythritol 4-phosphate cytidylyltransferase [Burkholderiales bacterium]|nr:2-C-methyl-D-erythritol 4-phosphate cytidylyltransferase [Burkholderiales bacterium]